MTPAEVCTPRTQRRILVVDDEPMVARTLQMILECEGHTVDRAYEGARALELFEAIHHDLVITDYLLPGLNGLELAGRVKQLVPQCPVLLVTGQAERLSAGKKLAGIDYLMPKPFSAKVLHDAVELIFGLDQASPEAFVSPEAQPSLVFDHLAPGGNDSSRPGAEKPK